MRILLEFNLKNEYFDKDFRKVILSFLKKTMQEEIGGILYKKYFEEDKYRDYTFVTIFDKPMFKKDRIVVEGKKLKIILSADDRFKTGLYLYGAMVAKKGNKFMLPYENAMVMDRVTLINTTKIVKNQIIASFTPGGGLVLRDHNRDTNKDKYIIFEDAKFQEQFKKIVSNQLISAGFSKEIAEGVSIMPLNCKKGVNLNYEVFVDVTLGNFVLSGEIEALQHLYDVGIGSRRGLGFGMFDVLEQLEGGGNI